MVRYIRCPSCNSTVISVKFDEYKEKADKKIRAEVAKKYPDMSIKNYAKVNNEISTDDIFDELGIKRICCRIHISSNYENIKEAQK